MKAVREGGSEERGRVLWDATSRGLCGRVGPPRTTVRVAWANCETRGRTVMIPYMCSLNVVGSYSWREH